MIEDGGVCTSGEVELTGESGVAGDKEIGGLVLIADADSAAGWEELDIACLRDKIEITSIDDRGIWGVKLEIAIIVDDGNGIGGSALASRETL